VPEVTEGCTDQCGTGTRVCSQGSWSECEVPAVILACSTVCGNGKRVCEHNTWKACDAPPPKPPRLIATIRDFHHTQADFELPLVGNFSEKNLVKQELGDDGTPVYNTGVASKTTSGADNFYYWYHTVGGSINRETTKEFQLAPSSSEPGLFVYSNDKFFPIDGELFGNELYNHNFHFTLQTKFSFRYIGGEVFRFSGDDDLWVFINGRRVMDLGGIHNTESATVSLDTIAADAHMERGQAYPLSLFFAERHTWESHFTVETSIADPGTCE
jgi:fibro-slime domain-containing protein